MLNHINQSDIILREVSSNPYGHAVVRIEAKANRETRDYYYNCLFDRTAFTLPGIDGEFLAVEVGARRLFEQDGEPNILTLTAVAKC